MTELDVRTAGELGPLVASRSSTFDLTLVFPSGYLVGKTWTSTLGSDTITPTVLGDVMTVTFTEAATDRAQARWTLYETTGALDTQPVVTAKIKFTRGGSTDHDLGPFTVELAGGVVVNVAVVGGEVITHTSTVAFGAVADARSVSDVSVIAGTKRIGSALAVFTQADVGKVVSLRVGATGYTSTVTVVEDSQFALLGIPGTFPATVANAVLTLGTDDTTAIQAAFNAVGQGGTVFHPSRESIITAPIVTEGSVSILGGGIAENTTGIVASSFGSGPSIAPYLRGAVWTQVTAGANIVEIPDTGANVHIRDIGLKFGPAIMFANTGHGVYASPVATYAPGGHENGLFNPRWDNVVVFGHDGNHYAYWIDNSNLGTFSHLRSHGGGILHLDSDSVVAGYGNAVYVAPYGRMFCGGTADGYHLACQETGAGQRSINLIDFIRPQCNILSPTLAPAFANLGITPPTVAQYIWRNVARTPGKYPSSINVIDPDLENDGVNAFPIDFGGMHSGTTVRNGGIMSNTPVGGYSTENRSAPGVPLQPTIVLGAGAGAGATAQMLQGNDQGGTFVVNSVAGGAADTPIITMTCPSMPPSGIKAVMVQTYGSAALASNWQDHFFVTGLADNSRSWTLRADQALPTYPFTFMFLVVPRDTPNNTI
ncbi:MAG: hypothetical protein LC798_07065 [Chloroflexi bacterium]|nr:hypothetical protein [Chloroflexota bacterium]